MGPWKILLLEEIRLAFLDLTIWESVNFYKFNIRLTHVVFMSLNLTANSMK